MKKLISTILALFIVFWNLTLYKIYAGVSIPTIENPAPIVKILYPSSDQIVNWKIKIKVQSYWLYGKAPYSIQFKIDWENYQNEFKSWTSNSSTMWKCDITCFFVMLDTTKYKDWKHTLTANAHNYNDDKLWTASITFEIKNTWVKKTTTNTNTDNKTKITTKLWTLSVSSSWDLYLTWRWYLWHDWAIYSLNPGLYTLYAQSPTTGEVCWTKNVRINSAKTTTVKISGVYCE